MPPISLILFSWRPSTRLMYSAAKPARPLSSPQKEAAKPVFA